MCFLILPVYFLLFLICFVHFSHLCFSAYVSCYFVYFYCFCLPLPLCPFHHVLLQHPPPRLTEKKRAGFGPFPNNPVLRENVVSCWPLQTQFGEIQVYKVRNNILKNIDTHTHTIFEGHTTNPSRKTTQPSPQVPIFIVFCSLQLYMKAQLLVSISPTLWRTGGHTHQTPHKACTRAWHQKCCQNALKHEFRLATIDVDSGLTLQDDLSIYLYIYIFFLCFLFFCVCKLMRARMRARALAWLLAHSLTHTFALISAQSPSASLQSCTSF